MARRKVTSGNRGGSPPGRLRIVAGKWRGRTVPVAADADGLRPTPARVRETLFNWLAPHIQGARCLDLFAGSGALGLEALSRGADEVVFVESDPAIAANLERAIDALSADGASIVVADAWRWLTGSRATYDVVFLDPPYADDSIGQLCTLLAARRILRPGARVYVEQDRDQAAPALPDDWTVGRQKVAGQVRYGLLVVPAD